MKIYLILAAGENDPLGKNDPFMPLVFPILASCAPEHDYTFINLLSDDASNIDYTSDFDIIGISYRVSAAETAFKIADKFRSLKKTVVLGGAQASSAPVKAKEYADAVVVGEGEDLWPVLLKEFEKGQLKDFYVACPQKIKELKKHNIFYLSSFPNLETFPKPNRQLIKKKYTFDVVFASRGCPENCSFCAVSNLFGTKMRFKKTETVVDEIKNFGKLYCLLDDNVFGRKDTYAYYKKLYAELLKLPKKRYWTGQANLSAAADNTGQEVIALASLSGLTYAAIGFETLNRNDMKKMAVASKMGFNKNENHLQQISKNIRYIQEQGVAVSAWFTIGLEHDTLKSINEVVNFCLYHNVFPVLTPIQALEGTRFFDEMKQQGKLQNAKHNASNVNLSELKNAEYINLMEISLKKGFSKKRIIKNTWFYFKKICALKKINSEIFNRTIFIFITQIRLKKIIKQEIKRFKSRIHHDI